MLTLFIQLKGELLCIFNYASFPVDRDCFPALMTSYDVQEEVMFAVCYKDVIGRPAGVMTVHACSQRGNGVENGPHLLKREESRSGMEPRSFSSPTMLFVDCLEVVR